MQFAAVAFLLYKELRFAILIETCKKIGRYGFKNILIVSSHGGYGNMIGNFTSVVLFNKKDYMVYGTDYGDRQVS